MLKEIIFSLVKSRGWCFSLKKYNFQSQFISLNCLKILWIDSWWLSDKAPFLYAYAFSLSVKNINISLRRMLIETFVKFPTPRHKNANPLKLCQFCVSERYYFCLCEYDILRGSSVFSGQE